MENSLRCSDLSKRSNKKAPQRLVASAPTMFSQYAHKHIASLSHVSTWNRAAGHMTFFLVKVAALEILRRLSRSKCPFVWRGFQALQFLCYPPFKWIQRWAPLKYLVKSMQTVSRPLLFLSIATAFSDQDDYSNQSPDENSASDSCSETQSELSSTQSVPELRTGNETAQSLPSEIWMIQLHNELAREGIQLPERINNEELRRFYAVCNNDFSSLLSSVKKTIRWRETYRILAEEELEMWSNFVFWHGFDVEERPCLIVRFGLACCSLPSEERPRLAQAVISQVEHGILHLVDAENPQITVVVDCEGLSPLRIPMQLVRSCSSILQDHFPDRLACLFIIRLPSVVRVIAQTFTQVLRPTTRKKLRIEGVMYKKTLLEYLQVLPSFLGGRCSCTNCLKRNISNRQQLPGGETSNTVLVANVSDDEFLPSGHPEYDVGFHADANYDQVIRTAIIAILMLWLFGALIAGIYDPESGSFMPF